jgi:putative flippase GtrA
MVQGLSKVVAHGLHDVRFRYLAAGGINTAFGYSVGIVAYQMLERVLHVFLISLAASVISITFSFLTYRLFVFKSRGNILREYLRCYAVYGVSTLVGATLIWLLVDMVRLNIYWAQGLVLSITVVFSYVGHKRYTFSGNRVASPNSPPADAQDQR